MKRQAGQFFAFASVAPVACEFCVAAHVGPVQYRSVDDILKPLARVVWWGLPWLTLLAISSSAAYGMTVAAAGTDSRAGRDKIATTTPVSSKGCDTTDAWILQNAIDNGWVPANSAGSCRGYQQDYQEELPR